MNPGQQKYVYLNTYEYTKISVPIITIFICIFDYDVLDLKK